MQDYKRLTNNNLEEYNPEYDFCMGCKYFGEPYGCNRPNGTCGNCDRFIETYNRLAELEDKIENGTLVELGKPYIRQLSMIPQQDKYIICKAIERVIAGAFTKAEAEAKLKGE